MRLIVNFIRLVIILSLVSCSPKAYFSNYRGTWVPMDSTSYPIVTKLQIEKSSPYYILGAKYSFDTTQFFFFICEKKWNHLSISPAQYNIDEYDVEAMLTQHSDIYYDRKLKCLYFLNAIYIPSKDRIFEIKEKRVKIIPPQIPEPASLKKELLRML
jgi:hypothetical protein